MGRRSVGMAAILGSRAWNRPRSGEGTEHGAAPSWSGKGIGPARGRDENDYERADARARTECSGRSSPSRSQPLHSHTAQFVKRTGDPARVIDSRIVSSEPQFGHRVEERVSGVMGYFSASG